MTGLVLFDWKLGIAEDSLNENHLKAGIFALPVNYRSYHNKRSDYFIENDLTGVNQSALWF